MKTINKRKETAAISLFIFLPTRWRNARKLELMAESDGIVLRAGFGQVQVFVLTALSHQMKMSNGPWTI